MRACSHRKGLLTVILLTARGQGPIKDFLGVDLFPALVFLPFSERFPQADFP